MEDFCSRYPPLSPEELSQKSAYYQFIYQHAERFRNQEEVTELLFEENFDVEAATTYWESCQYLKEGCYTSKYGNRGYNRDLMRVEDLIARIEQRARGLAIHTLSRSSRGNVVTIGDASQSQYDLLKRILDLRYGKEGVTEQRYYYYTDEFGRNQREFVVGTEYDGVLNTMPALEHPFWFIKKVRNPKTGILFRYHIYRLNILYNPVTYLIRIEIEFNCSSFNGSKWITI